MIRSYKLKHEMNQIKVDKVLSVITEYRKMSKTISKVQWNLFYTSNSFNKNLKIKNITIGNNKNTNTNKDLKGKLSERYKQTCQYQVVGILESYISNLQNKFKTIIYKSTLNSEVRKQLLYINKSKLWFTTKDSIEVLPTNDKIGFIIEKNSIKLSRKIIHRLMKINKKPNLSKINLSLDNKVAVLHKNDGSSDYDYWITFSTLDFRKQIEIPLKSNSYFEGVNGIIKNFCQINVNKNNKIEVCLIKEIDTDETIKKYSKKESEVRKVETLGIDIGLVNLITTSEGDLLGRKLYPYLKKQDIILTQLIKNLNNKRKSKNNFNDKNNIKNHNNVKLSENKRYKRLTHKIKNYIKNEVGRVFNDLINKYKPEEIVLENLNFKNMNLSKRLNRILNNFGLGVITKKLDSLSEEFGIEVVYVNSAYTSRECNSCGYVSKSNRKTQDSFECGCCGTKINADVNASRNIVARSSCNLKNIGINTGIDTKKYTDINIYTKKKEVFNILIDRFMSKENIERLKKRCLYSKARELLSKVPLGTK